MRHKPQPLMAYYFRMSEMNRRDMFLAMGALAAMGGVDAMAQAGGVMMAGGGELAHSQFFSFDKLQATTNPNGGQIRPVMHGTLPTGEYLEVHETMMPIGQMPHPPHRHTHSEMMLVFQGKLEAHSEG